MKISIPKFLNKKKEEEISAEAPQDEVIQDSENEIVAEEDSTNSGNSDITKAMKVIEENKKIIENAEKVKQSIQKKQQEIPVINRTEEEKQEDISLEELIPQMVNGLVNHEERLQRLEATLFRVKGSI